MKFGSSKTEHDNQPKRSGEGANWLARPKEGANLYRILDEPDAWVYFYEHFNPEGFSFPCHPDRTVCEGCTSDNPKMKKASEKAAFNVFDHASGFTNVLKVPRKSVADKLEARWERNPKKTLRDRDYIIEQIKDSRGVEYDVEGQDKEEFDFDSVKEHLKSSEEIQQMLADSYEEAWGNGGKGQETSARGAAVKAQLDGDPKRQPAWSKDESPKKELFLEEDDLRKMSFFQLLKICNDENLGEPEGDTVNEVVDWMMKQSK